MSTVLPPRVGELTIAWRVALIVAWVGAFVAYMAVWKSSEEIGIATWWLGPRSSPQPLLVRLIPFIVSATFGALASFKMRNISLISVAGAVALGAIAIPDFSRSVGLAVIELVIGVAVALVSLASLTGRYQAPRSHVARPRVAG